MASRRAAEWQQLVREWKRSGLSARRFAEARGLARNTLTWWQWRLGADADAARRARSERATPSDGRGEEAGARVALVRVVARQPEEERGTEGAPIEVLVGELVVRVRRGFDSETLGRVLEVLEGAEPRSC